MTEQEVKNLFAEKNQSHIFKFWDDLSTTEQSILLKQCENIDFEWLEERCNNVKNNHEEFSLPQKVSPAPVISLPKTEKELQRMNQAKQKGEQALFNGEIAIFLVAGGQGSRLGFNGPKGCYEIGPNSSKTLFQWHAEQIKAASIRYKTTIPWYIMTSTLNHNNTVEFFEKNNYFNLGKENVMCFKQRMVPSVDNNYKLILAQKNQLALNPDGHGGCLWALYSSGAITDMKKRGIKHLSYFQVDNPLVTLADPVFLGYHIEADADMSSKILKKANPEEKVGNICIGDGKPTVIEYSDMTEENTYAKDSKGELLFWAGSIAIHLLRVDFIEDIGGQAKLPWHVAKKKIPYLNQAGVRVKPEENNGIKFETFVFDALPMVKTTITMEVTREEEFAPVKNASGVDSAESCRQLLSNRFAKWLEKAGHKVDKKENGDSKAMIEVSPLFALDEEEFVNKCPQDIEIKDGMIL